jgi:hypothetical protein
VVQCRAVDGRSQRDELPETYGEEAGGGETSPTRK